MLHVDFSLTKYTELRDLTGQLNLFLSRWEEIYGKKEEEEGAAERLQGIILRAYAKTGKPVVVLIDEYDAPLLDSNSDALLQQQLRNEMRKFRLYKLAYPNSEVRYGFTESLLPSYVHRFPRENTFYVVSFLRDLMKGDLENKTEKHYQTIFYLLFHLMGQYVDSEVKSAIGRADDWRVENS